MSFKKKNDKSSTPESKAREKIIIPDLGKIETIVVDNVIDGPPTVQKYGIHPRATTREMPESRDMMVLSNYVKVTKIPDTLYVYSLRFSHPSKDDSRVEYNKKREIRDAYNALKKADALDLEADRLQWVTDFKSLWCTAPMRNHRDEVGAVFQSREFEYIQSNGRTVSNLRADVTFTCKLTDIKGKLETDDLAALPEYIRALNANVAECVVRHASSSGKPVTRVGANKFFLDRGYVERDGLRSGRGYFTSIRPGMNNTLLNINTATSAFLPPLSVSEFVRIVQKNDGLDYAAQLLQGMTVRILYKRQLYKGGVNYNSDQARLKVFAQFGVFAKDQRFFRLLKTEIDEPKKVDPTDKQGTSVYDYYTKGEFMFPLHIHTLTKGRRQGRISYLERRRSSVRQRRKTRSNRTEKE